MNLQEKVKYVMDEELSKKVTTKKGALVWFITEIIQMVVFVLGALLILWIFTPYIFWVKLGMTVLALIVVYDVFKSFVWVRWVLINESFE